jgi:hypothetical protein
MTLHLKGNIQRMEELRRLAPTEKTAFFDSIISAKKELQSRFKNILGGIDCYYAREAAAQNALLCYTSFTHLADMQSRLPGLTSSKRKLIRRLDEVLEMEKSLEALSGQLREQFATSEFKDEFRIGFQLSDEHLESLGFYRQSLN